ncbi:MAG: translesion error-prone DNA polymerase V autoproteolytic subunit [Acidobacteriota bacterium]|nr:translesion error-prone DNA polymerase V autoproteolytic subunit [Acidobacteriota bacterium]
MTPQLRKAARGGHQTLRVRSVLRAHVGGRCPVPFFLCLVPAGFPSPASDYSERDLDLNDCLVRNRLATYVVRVEGDSMAGEIHDGDLLVVDRSLEPRHGDVVIACVDGEMTVKRFVVEGGRRLLAAENPAYPAVELGGEREFLIWGVATHCIHGLR